MSVKMCLPFFKLCFIFSFLLIILIKGENHENCGVVAQPKHNRIVGGEIIGYMKYPWFASLLLVKNIKQLVCGGSLIHKRYVITAAHCFKPFFKQYKEGTVNLEDLYMVQLGTDNSCIRETGRENYATLKVYVHEKYFDDLLYYDIAVLYLDNDVNDFIPVCLPPARYESNNRTGLQGTIVGLGKESSTAWRLPCQVKQSTVTIQADTTCRNFLDANNENSDKFHNAFCAGSGLGDTDTCQGDSGGPLQVAMDDNRIMILGITSFGFGCAKKETYGVYTDVSHYLNWIESKLDLHKTVNVIAKDIGTSTPSTATPVKITRTRVQRKRKPTNIFQQIMNW